MGSRSPSGRLLLSGTGLGAASARPQRQVAVHAPVDVPSVRPAVRFEKTESRLYRHAGAGVRLRPADRADPGDDRRNPAAADRTAASGEAARRTQPKGLSAASCTAGRPPHAAIDDLSGPAQDRHPPFAGSESRQRHCSEKRRRTENGTQRKSDIARQHAGRRMPAKSDKPAGTRKTSRKE